MAAAERPRRARNGLNGSGRMWTVSLVLFALFGLGSAYPSQLPAGVTVSNLFNGIGLVTDLQFAFPDTAFMTFKNGTVSMAKIIGSRWRMQPYPSLDIGNRLGNAVGDRGLLSIAIDPAFKRNRFIYLAYVYDDLPINQLGPKKNRVSRFRMDRNLLFADPASERILLGSCPPGSSWASTNCYYMNGTTHSVNMIRFGPDRMLWVTMGDGIVADGPDWTLPPGYPAPMANDFLGGKLLRLDPRTGNGLPSNPFFDGNIRSVQSKVYSTGLRNPFAGDFTQRTSAPYEMIVGDVGWYTWESVKVLKRGNNLGWPCYEGGQMGPCAGRPCVANGDQPGCQQFYAGQLPSARYPGYTAGDILTSWDHVGRSSAAIGGTFFGAGWPSPFRNCFIYADFVAGWVRCMPFDSAAGVTTGAPIDIMRGADNPIRFIKHPKTNCVYYIAFCEFCPKYGAIRQLCWGKPPRLAPERTRVTTMTRRTTRTVPVLVTPTANPCVQPTRPLTDIRGAPESWGSVVYASNMFALPAAQGGAPPQIGLNNRTDCAATPGACVIGMDASQGPSQTAFAGQPLQIAGVRFAKGFGTMVTSQLNFFLASTCTRFTAYVGVDDEPGPNDYPSEFIVRRDDPRDPTARPIIIFNSTDFRVNRAMQKGDLPLFVDVDIRNATLVSLLGFSYWGNKFSRAATHVNWADAKFYCGRQSATLPKVWIIRPVDKTRAWRDGQTVEYEGYATDWNGTIIPQRNYRWELNMVHGQGATFHMHPQVAKLRAGVSRGSFKIAPHSLTAEQFYYYELRMYATDGCGRESWDAVYIKAEEAAAAAKSDPGTLRLNSIIGRAAESLLRRAKRFVWDILNFGSPVLPAAPPEAEDSDPASVLNEIQTRAATSRIGFHGGSSLNYNFVVGDARTIRKFITFKDMDHVLDEL